MGCIESFYFFFDSSWCDISFLGVVGLLCLFLLLVCRNSFVNVMLFVNIRLSKIVLGREVLGSEGCLGYNIFFCFWNGG